MNRTAAPAPLAAETQAADAPVIDSRQLFAPGQNTLLIAHGGQRYTLRLTRENKLILTK